MRRMRNRRKKSIIPMFVVARARNLLSDLVINYCRCCTPMQGQEFLPFVYFFPTGLKCIGSKEGNGTERKKAINLAQSLRGPINLPLRSVFNAGKVCPISTEEEEKCILNLESYWRVQKMVQCENYSTKCISLVTAYYWLRRNISSEQQKLYGQPQVPKNNN